MVYAGVAGLVLQPTGGTDKEKVIVAMDNLQAGLDCRWRRNHPAYEIAQEIL
jgi:hypothetical protein